jgi:hypothetical protein
VGSKALEMDINTAQAAASKFLEIEGSVAVS